MSDLKLGYCNICGVTQTWYIQDKKAIFTPEYVEIYFLCTDEVVYRHGICTSCINNLTDEKMHDLFGKIKQQWEDNMVGWGTHAQFMHIRSLQIIAYDKEEELLHEMQKIAQE